MTTTRRGTDEPIRVGSLENDPFGAFVVAARLNSAGLDAWSVGDPVEFLNLVEARQPHMVFVDLNLGDWRNGGLDCLRTVKSRWPHVKCVVLTSFDFVQNLKASLLAGADGFIKKEHTTDLPDIVRRALAGEPLVPLHKLKDLASGVHESSPEAGARLTKRETEVLQALPAPGGRINSDKEIGDALGISPETVHHHLKQIRTKLAVNTREDAVFHGRMLGYLK